MKEHEIRPEAILSSYIELSVQDAEFYFKNEECVSVNRVEYGVNQSVRQFVKNAFAYAQFNDCGTLFKNPRPTIDKFEFLS